MVNILSKIKSGEELLSKTAKLDVPTTFGTLIKHRFHKKLVSDEKGYLKNPTRLPTTILNSNQIKSSKRNNFENVAGFSYRNVSLCYVFVSYKYKVIADIDDNLLNNIPHELFHCFFFFFSKRTTRRFFFCFIVRYNIFEGEKIFIICFLYTSYIHEIYVYERVE